MAKIPDGLVVRLLQSTDSIAELTDLLHRAYKPLADMGLRFVATYQDEETTRKRAAEGECHVAELEGQLVATATFYRPGRPGTREWYARPEVAAMGQFAVEPALQRRGIGALLMDLAEQRAREWGATEMAVDTSEHAHHLIALYKARGHRVVQHIQWKETNYRSIVLSKRLSGGPT